MSRAKIFAYKGALGAETDIDNGTFLNDPKGPNQMGVVIPSSEVDITKEAKELLKNASRESGSFSGIMLTKHSDGSGNSIGLLGFWKHLFLKDDITIGRDCDKEIIDDFNETIIEIPQGFKDAVNKNNK